MRVKQYPHYLFLQVGGESVQDSKGNWVKTSEHIEMISKCREETNGKGSQIQVAGGTYHVFSSLIQLPKGARRVEVGANILISNDELGTDIRVKGTVLKFDDGQLHSRLWL